MFKKRPRQGTRKVRQGDGGQTAFNAMMGAQYGRGFVKQHMGSASSSNSVSAFNVFKDAADDVAGGS